MKLLCFSDLHSNLKLLSNLVERALKDDILGVICAGDYSDFGTDSKKILSTLDSIKKPIFLIHGNHEMESDIKDAEKRYDNIINIHKSLRPFHDILIVGFGGGGFSLTDPRFEKFVKDSSKIISKYDKVVLVTHAPPYDTKLDIVGKSHVGNKSIKDFIEKYQPLYALSGHIHDCHGAVQKIKNSALINLGPKGTVIEF